MTESDHSKPNDHETNPGTNPGILGRIVSSPRVQSAVATTQSYYNDAKSRDGHVKTVLLAAESGFKTVASCTVPLATPVLKLIGAGDLVDGSNTSSLNQASGSTQQGEPESKMSIAVPPEPDLKDKSSPKSKREDVINKMDSIFDNYSSLPEDDRQRKGARDIHTTAVGLPVKAREILKDRSKSHVDLHEGDPSQDGPVRTTIRMVHLGYRRGNRIYNEVHQEPFHIVTWSLSLVLVFILFTLKLVNRISSYLWNRINSSHGTVSKISQRVMGFLMEFWRIVLLRLWQQIKDIWIYFAEHFLISPH